MHGKTYKKTHNMKNLVISWFGEKRKQWNGAGVEFERKYLITKRGIMEEPESKKSPDV